MTLVTTSRQSKPRKRQLPHPNSVLDTPNFIAALEAADLYGTKVLPVHILAFYQALHRQHYPDLPTFVENYYANEQNAIQNNSGNSDGTLTSTPFLVPHNTPLKNRVTTQKNRNRMQLPRALLDFLRTRGDDWCTLTTRVARCATSADGSTTKLVIALSDLQYVESVLMRYAPPNKTVPKSTTGYGQGRAALCVSSQCGCAMGCTFCATGTMGFSGNLTVGEILEQVVHADRLLAEEWRQHSLAEDHGKASKLDLVRNIVFMGMGEPLDNYDNVVAACRALTDNRRWNVAHSRVTVSTVGLVDKIRKLTEDLPEVNLAVSLHAPNQALRTAIVPTANRYPIEDLVDALDNHMMTFLSKRKRMRENPQNGELVEFTKEERIKESTRRRAMIEYVMLEGPTSTMEAAHELGKLCEGRQLVVNLIPYNQTNVKDKLRCPSEEHMQAFRNIVTSYGAFCTIRRTMGDDIDSACGQLVNMEQIRRRSTDMEDVVTVSNSATFTKAAPLRSVKRDPNAVSSEPSWLLKSLVVATAVSASCFVACSVLFVSRRRR